MARYRSPQSLPIALHLSQRQAIAMNQPRPDSDPNSIHTKTSHFSTGQGAQKNGKSGFLKNGACSLNRFQKHTVIGFSTVLMALAVAPEARVTAQMRSIQATQTTAQVTNPQTSFRLPQSVADGIDIQIDGSTSLQTTVMDLRQRFEERFEGATVTLGGRSDGQALARLQQGAIEIAAIGRALTAEEKAAGLDAVPMEREKVAIFVSSDNPFQGELTFDQFVQIFRGDVQDWAALGGEGRIRFLDRPDTSDTRRSLGVYDIFGGNLETGDTAEVIDADTTEAVIAALGDDGVGYGVYSQVRNNPDVRIISMHGVSATHSAYPYSQPRNFVYDPETLSEAGQAFLGLVTTVAAQENTPAERLAAVGTDETERNASASDRDPDAASDRNATHDPDIEGDRETSERDTAEASDPDTETAGTTASPIPDPTTASDPTTSSAPPEPMPSEAVHGMIADAVDGTADTEMRQRDRPPLGLMIIPILLAGGGIWAWRRNQAPQNRALDLNRGMVGADIPPAPPLAATAAEPHIRFTTHSPTVGQVTWELPDHQKQALKANNHGLKVRLHDVTTLDTDQAISQQTMEFDCPPYASSLLLPIGQPDRDYQAELGYSTPETDWVSLARSPHVHAPPSTPGASPVEQNGVALATGRPLPSGAIAGAAIAGAALAGAAVASTKSPTPEPATDTAEPPTTDETTTDPVETDRTEASLTEAGLAAANLPETEQAESGLTEPDRTESDLGETEALQANGLQTNGAATHLPEVKAPEDTPEVLPAALTGEGIEQLQLHSQTHRFPLETDYLNALQGVAATQAISQGIYKIFIKDGVFGDRTDPEHSGEPWVLLFLAGGRVINQKTQVPVSATWSTLNGYDDRLVVEVIEPTILHAVFVDTDVEDNEGEMTVSIERLPS
ncbi:MAG: substrate-binding domain-containing protein [Cyanobacteria bacterium J06638_20]